MKRFSLATVAAAVVLTGAAAAPGGAAPALRARSTVSCTGAIDWSRARQAIGRVVTIKGRVAGTFFASSSNGSPTFLNLGVDYPNGRRTSVVIWIENRSRFGAPERTYRGRTICVRGLVSTYAGVPEIEAKSPAQIRIVG